MHPTAPTHATPPPATTTGRHLTFTSRGVRCAAWHLPAASGALAGPGGRPCVVMAHGFGGTLDSGLRAFAEPLAAAGLDVLAFDYRGFGRSEGVPRQRISTRGQRQDYHAAIAAARRIPGVDRDRIVLWGPPTPEAMWSRSRRRTSRSRPSCR